MRGAKQRVRRQGRERHERHILADLQIVGDRDLGLRPPQAVQQPFLMALQAANLGLREGLEERCDQFRHDDGRQRREPSHRQLAAHLMADVGRRRIQTFGLLQQLLRVAQQRPARRRQRQALRVMAQEQLHVEFALDVRDGGRNGGLRNVGALRGERDAAGFGRGDEVAQLPESEFHAVRARSRIAGHAEARRSARDRARAARSRRSAARRGPRALVRASSGSASLQSTRRSTIGQGTSRTTSSPAE